MKTQTFDLAIVGGGINGAGVARDAASRGLKVALIEANDFASGTSSRSSKLVHGGIRYLENLEFGLVFEALRERQLLFEIAPHLVHPLRFVLPVYKGGRVPAWQLGLGLWIYDALSMFDAPELHQHFANVEVESNWPVLNRKNLSGVFTYYDAYMDDDRLVIETLRSARALGAELASYVKATSAETSSDKLSGVKCKDQISGDDFVLRAKHFVSTVGPWTDDLGSLLVSGWKKKLRPSKGVHLTFSKSRFAISDAIVMAAENRIVFAIPRHEMVILGTTDTDYGGKIGEVRAEKEDVEYLLQVANQYFPGASLSKSDIIGCYAGVRPLVDDGSENEGKTSREHSIWTDPCGLTFVAGGKYTTYRAMAEETVDHVLDVMDLKTRFGLSKTKAPLNPVVTPELFERAKMELQSFPMLAERHGLEANDIVTQAREQFRGWGLNDEEWIWCAEALHAIRNTMCMNLTDFFFRRTPLVLSKAGHGLNLATQVAKVFAQELGWSPTRVTDEINALQNHLAREMAAVI